MLIGKNWGNGIGRGWKSGCRGTSLRGKKLLSQPPFSLYTPEHTHSDSLSIKIIPGEMYRDDRNILSSCVAFQLVSRIGCWMDLLFIPACFTSYRGKLIAWRFGKPAQLRNVGLQAWNLVSLLSVNRKQVMVVIRKTETLGSELLADGTWSSPGAQSLSW